MSDGIKRPTGRPRKYHTEEEQRARHRAYNAKRDPEKAREYHRRIRALAKLAIAAGLELPPKP